MLTCHGETMDTGHVVTVVNQFENENPYLNVVIMSPTNANSVLVPRHCRITPQKNYKTTTPGCRSKKS